jgi:hypothetical protein
MAERVGPRKMVFKLEAGAATSMWAGLVADADTVGGHYCENCGVADVTTDPASTTGVSGYALDGDRARALWTLSERLVGERFGRRLVLSSAFACVELVRSVAPPLVRARETGCPARCGLEQTVRDAE